MCRLVSEALHCYKASVSCVVVSYVCSYGFHFVLLYFFGYKTAFFPFQNNRKNLDPSYKTELDIWNCLGRVKLML